MGRLDSKICAITGAGSGIGRGSAEMFAREGACVVVTDLRVAAAEEVAHAIVVAGGRAIALAVDIGHQDDIRGMIDKTVAEFGGIDVLFNNALYADPKLIVRDNDLLDYDPEVFEILMRGNVLGGVLAAKFALPHMLAKGAGSIIFTSSISALGGDVGAYTYGPSKAAVNCFAQSIATTFGKRGIRSNVILPGNIRTAATAAWSTPEMDAGFMKLLNSPRMGEPADIAYLAVYLASDESRYVNGSLFRVDGGIGSAVPFISVTREAMEAGH